MKRQLTILMTAVCLLLGSMTAAHAAVNYPPQDTTITITSTNLPIVWIEVGGDSIMRDQRITGRMRIIHNGDGQLNWADTVAHPGQHIDYEGYVALRYRGNTSFTNSPKKPFSFHTMNAPLEVDTCKKQKEKILGMGKDNKWALLAPYADKSMIRDLLAFELARPWMEYVPQGRLCELFLDGIYYGVYVLTEVVSKGKHRLNLPDPGNDEESITGGYIMEVGTAEGFYHKSKYYPMNSNSGGVYHDKSIYFQYDWPDYEDMTQEQIDYIDGAIDQMEAAFASTKYKDPEVGFRKYVDVQNFIDYQLAEELARNVDAYRLSGKFFKRRDSVDSRFKMVIWDMNLAYGNARHLQGWSTDKWMYNNNPYMYMKGEQYLIPFWWYKINKDDDYKAQVRNRWAQYRESNVSETRVMATIDSLTRLITSHGALERNSQAWPTWGEWVWPNYYISTSYDDEIRYMKEWLVERIAWMDSKLGYVPPEPPEPQVLVGDANDDGQITIADLNFIIDVILSGNSLDAAGFKRCDVNADGEITVADIAALIDILLTA